jgi:hypothetical protein
MSAPPVTGSSTRASVVRGNGVVVVVLRRLLLGLLYIGMAGVSAELLLLEHMETWQQYIPFIALALGFVTVTAAALRPGRGVLLALRGCMLLFVVAGVTGIYLHYSGNVEFELEMYAGLKGRELIWKALTGATPVGAPGFLAQLGLLGLVYTYRHPHLNRRSATDGMNLEES